MVPHHSPELKKYRSTLLARSTIIYSSSHSIELEIHMKRFLLGTLLVLGSTLYAQEYRVKNFRLGIEYGSFIIADHGAYTPLPGFLFGFATGIPIVTDADKSILLGLEFNYKRTILFHPGVSYTIINRWKYLDTYDEKYSLSTIEIGVLPEYRFPLNNTLTVGLYAGAALGAGISDRQHKLVSHVQIDTTQYQPDWLLEGPYDGNIFPFIGTLTFNYRANIFYNGAVLDLRFSILKDAVYNSPKSIHQFYLLLGVLL